MSAPVSVAVLGALDAGAEQVADALNAAGSGTLRAQAHTPAATRPDAALLVVDPVCPIRPDDIEIARTVAATVPLLVAVVDSGSPRGVLPLGQSFQRTGERLAAAGLRSPMLLRLSGGAEVRGDADQISAAAPPLSPADLVSHLDLLARGPRAARSLGPPHRPPSPDPRTIAAETLDWLSARRTEAISARSTALRQDVQTLRMEIIGELHRGIREHGHEARSPVQTASRRALPDLVSELAHKVDYGLESVFSHCDAQINRLLSRHLGPGAPQAAAADAPCSGITYSAPPRHRTEEALTMVMGAAGGTGVGRLLLAPVAHTPQLGTAVVPVAVAVGLALGATTVVVRRIQTLRTYVLSTITERLVGVRSEAEQLLGARMLAAESVVAEGFAHDPGPRVADLDRRIRALRREGSPS